jgi:hypothetical protein
VEAWAASGQAFTWLGKDGIAAGRPCFDWGDAMNRWAQIRRKRQGIVYARHQNGKMVRLDQTGDNAPTPDHIARRITGYFVKTYGPLGSVLCPCAGAGAFYQHLPGEEGIDKDWCEIQRGRNFLDWKRHVDWIIDNTPWRSTDPDERRWFKQILRHAFEVADNVVFLLTVEGGIGLRSRIWLAREMNMGVRTVIILPKFKTRGGIGQGGRPFAVIHWQRGYLGKVRLVNWDESARTKAAPEPLPW